MPRLYADILKKAAIDNRMSFSKLLTRILEEKLLNGKQEHASITIDGL